MRHFLASLDDAELQLIVSLPYRVGLFVSACDSTGGDASAAQELEALATLLTSFTEDTCKSEFAQAVMEETIARRSQWAGWGGDLTLVPADCTRAIDVLADKIDIKHLYAFKQNLIEIATAVAMAYRELDRSRNLTDHLCAYAAVAGEKFRAAIGGRHIKSNAHLMNISRAERKAIDAITIALKITRR